MLADPGGVILRGPINDLKFHLLLPEVCRGTEDDIQIITPKGYVGLPGMMP
jgi:hypothetical protein